MIRHSKTFGKKFSFNSARPRALINTIYSVNNSTRTYPDTKTIYAEQQISLPKFQQVSNYLKYALESVNSTDKDQI